MLSSTHPPNTFTLTLQAKAQPAPRGRGGCEAHPAGAQPGRGAAHPGQGGCVRAGWAVENDKMKDDIKNTQKAIDYYEKEVDIWKKLIENLGGEGR